MEEYIKNLEAARLAFKSKIDSGTLEYERLLAESTAVWEQIVSYRNSLCQIDEALSVLKMSAKESTCVDHSLCDFVDSVIFWEASHVAGVTASEMAKVVEYKLDNYEQALRFVSSRTEELLKLEKIKFKHGKYFTTMPYKVAKPFSVAAKVNGYRHGYIPLPPMVEPNVKSLRAVAERQNWFKKHKYHTFPWNCEYNQATNIFQMKKAIKTL